MLSQKKSGRGRYGRENEVAAGEAGRQTGLGKTPPFPRNPEIVPVEYPSPQYVLESW
jgi:hypothetical protein